MIESATVSYTWYVRDAQGNALATYTANKDTGTTTTLGSFVLYITEHNLFGSSRLGTQNRQDIADNGSVGQPLYSARGLKFYELSNHLGNVLTSISDKKIGHNNGAGGFDYYNAEVVSATDYYAFGMRSRYDYQDPLLLDYRYGFNGQERNDDVKGGGNSYTAEFWEYDPRLGRRWNLDPRPMNGISEYSGFGNNPIQFSDPLGDTLSNPQLADASRLASKEIKDALRNNRGFFIPGTNTRLLGAAQEYIKQNNLNLGDASNFIGQVSEYHNGLASVAMKSVDEFNKLDRAVLNNKSIPDFQRLSLTIGFINNSDGQFRFILNTSAQVALSEAYGVVGIRIGKGPVGPRINSELQQSIVNAGTPKVPFSGSNVSIYRGANGADALFQLKGGEYKFTDKTVRGLSLHIDAPKLTNARGAAYQLTSMPTGLRIVQQGKDLGHYEIIPTSKMSQEQFQNLLNQIKYTKSQ